MTMQNIVPDPSRYPIPDVDVYLTGAEDSLQPAIILDYAYGALVYQRWKSDSLVHEKLRTYFADHYQFIQKKSSTTRMTRCP